MDQRYDHYASMREYTQMGHLHQVNDNDHSDESDIDIIEHTSRPMMGRGRRTANDCKQWMFVVKKTDPRFSSKSLHELDETEPLLTAHNNVTDALNELHQIQTRNTLEIDVRRTDLHLSPAVLPESIPSPVPNVEFLYIGISEKRMKYWCDSLKYQLNLCPELIVEWLLMVDNQLAHATHNDAIENRQFNLKCWRDLYCRYYSQHVNQEIYKFYRKYGYGYDEHYAKDQFHIATDTNIFSRDISQGSIFREVDRIRLTKFSFQSSLSPTMNNGYMSTFPIDEINKRIKNKDNVLIDAFVCHEYDVLADLYQQIWTRLKCTSPSSLFKIPLAGIRDYYGEKVAFYFLFLVHYNRYMVPLASVGFFYQIYQITSGDVEVELIGFFAILVLIWGSLIPLLWRQQETSYACKWGQYSNELSNPERLEKVASEELSKSHQIQYIFEPEMERVEFKGKPRRSTIDGAVIKTDDELQRARNYIISWGLFLTVILAVTGISVLFVIFMIFIQRFYSEAFIYGTYGFGILNSICMLIMEYISLWFIPLINDFENHRTNIQHKKALIQKKLLFDFVNYYVSLLFIIFVLPLTDLNLSFLVCDRVNCMLELETHFMSVFVSLIVFRCCIYLYNFTCGRYSYRKMKRVPSTAYFKPFYDIHNFSASASTMYAPPSRKAELTASEYLLYNYEDDIQKPLNEFVIQFGYLITFGLFFPWAAPISLVYNLLVIRLELHKLTVYCRRPFPQGASSIAPYNTAFKLMTLVSVLVTFYIFTVDSYELRIVNIVQGLFPKLLDWIALVLMFGIFYGILTWLFPAVSSRAKDHIKRQMFVDQSIATNYHDMKSFQESLTVSSLLRLRQWTVKEVHDYFDCFGHPRYTQFSTIVLSRQIDGEKLCHVTKRDLQLFGVQDQYHRMWIEREIEALKELYHQVYDMMMQRRNAGGAQTMDNIHMDTVRALMRNERIRTHAMKRMESQMADDIDEPQEQEPDYEQMVQQQEVEEVEEEEEEAKEMKEVQDINEQRFRNKSVSAQANEFGLIEEITAINAPSHTAMDVNDTPRFIDSLLSDEDLQLAEQQGIFIQFGDAKVGTLTTSLGGKEAGDVLVLRDIITQFHTVIKEAARAKLIKSFASKKIKVNEFKSVEEIYGLLELIILLIIRLKYKDNVTYDKALFRKELTPFIEWIMYDKETMNGRAWSVGEFADTFDEWIGKIIL